MNEKTPGTWVNTIVIICALILFTYASCQIIKNDREKTEKLSHYEARAFGLGGYTNPDLLPVENVERMIADSLLTIDQVNSVLAQFGNGVEIKAISWSTKLPEDAIRDIVLADTMLRIKE